MSTTTENTAPIKGAEWLITTSQPAATYTCEDFNEEELMIRDMCTQFLEKEILTRLDEIVSMKDGLMASLVQKAGEKRLHAAFFPEEYGRTGNTLVTSTSRYA